MIMTARMRLVPTSVTLARTELTDRAEFARPLSATVPDEWRPAILADTLPRFLEWIEAAPDRAGWYVWYAIMRAPHEAADMLTDDAADILIASGGFKGPPQDGAVEIGYSVLPQFQSQGYATEMVRSLIDWVFAQPDVTRIIAETTKDNGPSVRLLHRLGFVRTGSAVETGHFRFVLDGHTDRDFD